MADRPGWLAVAQGGGWRPMPATAAIRWLGDSAPLPALPCRGQLISLRPGRYDWIYLALASPAGNGAAADSGAGQEDEEVWLHYADLAEPEWLHLTPGPGPARVPVTRLAHLDRLRLPDRPSLGVRAIALVGALAMTDLTESARPAGLRGGS
jgi:hypothetical protein